MSIAFVSPTKNAKPWLAAIRRLADDIPVVVWPEIETTSEVKMAIVWDHPSGSLRDFSNLQLVSSLGAGAEQLIADECIQSHIHLARIVDPNLTKSMTDFLLAKLAAIRHHHIQYWLDKHYKKWQPRSPVKISDLTIAILGLGKIGGQVAINLATDGYEVNGWSSSEKQLKGVNSFFGEEQLTTCLASADVVINLLPLTAKTDGILGKEVFKKMKTGAFLINVGRGAHVNESDLITVLDSEKLAGAYLDVFPEEPLAPQNLLWSHPKVFISPHVSSLTEPESAAKQIVENYRRVLNGQTPINLVDRLRGY